MMKPYLNMREVAARLGISERTVRRMVTSGALPASRIGGSIRISSEDLAQYVESRRIAPHHQPLQGESLKGMISRVVAKHKAKHRA